MHDPIEEARRLWDLARHVAADDPQFARRLRGGPFGPVRRARNTAVTAVLVMVALAAWAASYGLEGAALVLVAALAPCLAVTMYFSARLGNATRWKPHFGH